jgi:hypothetical protein
MSRVRKEPIHARHDRPIQPATSDPERLSVRWLVITLVSAAVGIGTGLTAGWAAGATAAAVTVAALHVTIGA